MAHSWIFSCYILGGHKVAKNGIFNLDKLTQKRKLVFGDFVGVFFKKNKEWAIVYFPT